MFRSMYLLVIAFAAGLALASLVGIASAQTTTLWSGAISSHWSEPTNWEGGLPNDTTDVIINPGFTVGNDPVLNANGSALSVAIGVNGLESEGIGLTIASDVTLAVVGNVYVGEATGTTSTITQSNGTLSCVELWLGSTVFEATGAGAYNLSGGTLDVTGQMVVGEQGFGTFTQTGGVVNANVFYVGDNYIGKLVSAYPGAGATMSISGGVFNGGPYHGIIGTWGGNGTLNVNGTGVVNTNALEMGLSYEGFGNTAGSDSAINLSDDGQINLAGHLRLAANEATTGVLTQTGGTLTVGTLMKGPGTGTYNLTGGTLNVSAVADMDLANNGATLNVGGPGAIETLVFGDAGGDPVNMALGKTATQSSYYTSAWPSSNGVDGNYANMIHTLNEANSWWRVDLTGDATTVPINDILIAARSDGYNQHFSNFFVRVLDDDGVTVLWQDKFITDTSEYLDAAEVLSISVPEAVEGRYVEVQIDGMNLVGTGYLFFAEMEVYDSSALTPSAYTDYMQSSSSTLGIELDPTNALCDSLAAGAITLAGTLDVTALSEGFASGQIFDILDWETLIGTFATVNLPVLPGSLSWDQSNLYVDGTLSIIGGDPIPGDATGDNMVDEADAKRLAQYWGTDTKDPGLTWWQMGDFDGNNVVDARDAAILAAHWGLSGATEAAGVPEPGSLAMLLAGVVGLLARRRRACRHGGR